MTTLGWDLVKTVTISVISFVASTVLSGKGGGRGERGQSDVHGGGLSPSSTSGCQSIGDIQIGLAGRSGLNRFGRLELLVETTLDVTMIALTIVDQ